MDDKLINALLIIVTSVIGVSVLAVILSNRSNTVGVLGAASGGLSQILATAISPVTGGGSGGGSSPINFASLFGMNNYGGIGGSFPGASWA